MVSKKPLKPFFSVITTTYNSARYLRQCLDSLNNQDFHDYEHIVIDGGSSDDTHNILRRAKANFLILPALGVSNAMNEGIRHTKGQYLYFLHSDDQLANSHVLSDIHDYLSTNKDLDWCYGQVNVINQSSNTLGIFPNKRIFHTPNRPLLWLYNYIPHQAVFMKKSVFNQHGHFDESYRICMDYEYWLRVTSKTKWAFTPTIVAKYRTHAQAISVSRSNMIRIYQEKFRLRLKHFLS